MSVLDAFFNKGFKGAKCKTLLKLTIPRIKLLRNKREIHLKQLRRDIAKLLENGQEATARIRVEHIIREENMMAAQEVIELFCELIAVRLPIIETQRECPLDLKEAISSICFAAPRCSDLPELQQVQMLFAAKYGREFVAAATELMPDCGVNRQIIELLSIRAPSVEAKLKLLKEIAEEHEVEWDPAASETEFLKPHEDLLNGPNHIISGSTIPLPKEKHEDSVSSEHTVEHHEEADLDEGFDSSDLPEVPKVSVRATSDIPSAPEPSTTDQSTSHHLGFNNELKNSESSKNIEDEVNNHDELTSLRNNKPFQFVPFDEFTPPRENKPFQFVPFVACPPPLPFPLPSEQSDQSPYLSCDLNPPSPPFSLPSKNSDPTPFITHDPTPSNAPTKIHSDIDLQDVLAAAQTAAEAADRAAEAARAVASLAQVRIAELVMKKSEYRTSGSSEKNGSALSLDPKEIAGKPTFDQQNSFDYTNHFSGYDVTKMEDSSPNAKDYAHQPQKSDSMEDDPYFSYPNLFNRQDSGLQPNAHSSDEHSRSGHGF